MKVKIFRNQRSMYADTTEFKPDRDSFENLAAEYVENCDLDTGDCHDIVIEPVDAEAEALAGWLPPDEQHSKPYRLFLVGAEIRWKAHEVHLTEAL